jgi:hypothetical protein
MDYTKTPQRRPRVGSAQQYLDEVDEILSDRWLWISMCCIILLFIVLSMFIMTI